MKVISVTCPPDPTLHLAPYEWGRGTSVFTLCLERWRKREDCREDSKFCSECVLKWREREKHEEHEDRG